MENTTKLNLMSYIIILQLGFFLVLGLQLFFTIIVPKDEILTTRATVIAERELRKCYENGACALTYGNTQKVYILLNFKNDDLIKISKE